MGGKWKVESCGKYEVVVISHEMMNVGWQVAVASESAWQVTREIQNFIRLCDVNLHFSVQFTLVLSIFIFSTEMIVPDPISFTH